ncbi:MAG: hypothetical protein OQK82_04900 [Candidatus Pacearchaeota archaeon]|nr:hypothetical protein [Candidatus Pacearchaeota archaeon]
MGILGLLSENKFGMSSTEAQRRDEPELIGEIRSPALRLKQDSSMNVPFAGEIQYSHKRKSLEEIGKVVYAIVEFHHLNDPFNSKQENVRDCLLELGFEKVSSEEYKRRIL